MLILVDKRGKNHRGRFVVFADGRDVGYITVFSSESAALDELKRFSWLPQSMHNAAGDLVASAEKGKVTLYVGCI